MSVLTVYKASAGSGKTFQLTAEYLKIIFRNPEDYKTILAVTFTHKATAEMKARILNELYKLSIHGESEISEMLCRELNCNKNEVFSLAASILKKILHHFSQFHVSTIDSFFQGIISSFARDLGLQANFSVELNSSKVLNAVVDALLTNLDQDPVLARWLIDFAEDKVSKGESWELKKEIKKLGNELFKEDYAFGQFEKTADKRKEQILKFRDELFHLKNKKEENIKELVNKVKSEISGAGLEIADFSFGWNGAAGYLLKLEVEPSKRPGTRVKDALHDAEKWSTKNSIKRQRIIELAGHSLISLLKEGTELSYSYLNLELLSSNIYTLGVLSDLQINISEYAREHNLFLLDQTPWLINKLMDSNDAPFIYEKEGNRFQHFMIDEFQDTSSLQWMNFSPLILNSLSQNKDCMLVGDVKQSIYRWRNSNWTTLASLNEETDYVKVQALDTNWRSKPLLVRFNNTLFTLASDQLQVIFEKEIEGNTELSGHFSRLIPAAYEGLVQKISKIPDDNSGYAAIKFVQKEEKIESNGADDEESKSEIALEEARIFIDKLLASGYQMKEIAILVRNKTEGTRTAEYLVNQKRSSGESYRIISNDALLLNKASSIKLIIAVMQWLQDENDECNNLFLASELAQDTFDSLFPEYFKKDELAKYLPAHLIAARERMSLLPLFDLLEYVVFLLRLAQQDGQYPYLQAFMDLVHEFCQKESANLPEFLSWWQDNSAQFSISAPEAQDAIRIITIHKAKGLEYKAVIVPFCNWELDHKSIHSPILWCDTKNTEFSDLGLVPIRYKKDLAGSEFAGAYYKEKFHAFVDNLNLLYVALTRAKDCLFVVCELTGRQKRIGNLIQEVFNDPAGLGKLEKLGNLSLQNFIQADANSSQFIEFGAIPVLKSPMDSNSQTSWKGKINLPADRIKIRAHNEEYFLPLLDPSREGKINRGLVVHEVLSGIELAEDIPEALRKMNSRGLIPEKDIKEIGLEISKLIEDPRLSSWFTKDWTVLRETGIIEKYKGLQRPDRVMVKDNKAIVMDYKTGEKENKKYKYQLEEYMTALRKMGYTEIQGFIWYLRLGKLEEVKERN